PKLVLITRAGYYAKRLPARSDVVTFLVRDGQKDEVWLQRIIGLPGESVAIESGKVLVQGKPLDEPYVSLQNVEDDYSSRMPVVRIPAGHYFLLGDNRDNSVDSRVRGLTPREDLTGKVVGRLSGL
ncbi:MAG: signal peptidase I, partial [Proteobacteria bacterium]